MTPTEIEANIAYVTSHPEVVKTAFVQRFADKGHAVTVQYMPFRQKFAVYWQDEYTLFTVAQVATQEMSGLVAQAIESWRLPFA